MKEPKIYLEPAMPLQYHHCGGIVVCWSEGVVSCESAAAEAVSYEPEERNLQSQIRNPQSQIRNPQSEIRNPMLPFILLLGFLPLLLSAQTLYPVQRDGRWGYIDSTGTVVIPLEYERALSFDSATISAPVLLNGKWGLMDRKGTWRVKPRYAAVDDDRDDENIRVLDGTEWILINRKGRKQKQDEHDLFFDDYPSGFVYFGSDAQDGDTHSIERADEEYELHDGRHLFKENNLFGYLDSARTLVIPLLYDDAENFRNGLALVAFEDEADTLARQYPDPDEGVFYRQESAYNGRLLWGVIDTAGREIVPLEFQDIEVLPFHKFILVRQNGKWGAYDFSGNLRIPVRYKSLDWMGAGYVAARAPEDQGRREEESMESWGVITEDGAVVVPFNYESVYLGLEGQFIVDRKNRRGVFELQKGEVVPPQYLDIRSVALGYYCVYVPDNDTTYSQNSGDTIAVRKGLISKDGHVVVEPIWKDSLLVSSSFHLRGRGVYLAGLSDGEYRSGEIRMSQKGNLLCVVRIDNGKRSIRSDGSFIYRQDSSVLADTLLEFHEGVAYTQDRLGREAFVDTAGTLLFYLDTLGNDVRLVEPFFAEGKIPIDVDERGLAYYDKTGRRLFGEYAGASSFSEGLAVVHDPRRTNKPLVGYVDSTGAIAISHRFCDAGLFRNGFAPACNEENRLWGYINKEGEWVIPPQFHDAGPFANGRARVMVLVDSTVLSVRRTGRNNREELWGFIDTAGKVVIPPQFLEAQDFENGVAVVRTDEGFKHIDISGKVLKGHSGRLANPGWIGYFSEGLAPASIYGGQNYGYINRRGEWVIPPRFRRAEPFIEGRAEVAIQRVEEPVMYINAEGKIIWQEES